MKVILLSLSLFALSLSSIAGTIDPNTPDIRYQQYATKFHYVGLLCGEYNNGDIFCGSAVAIDDHNILTAAHVVDNVKFCILTLNDKVYCISNIIIHSDFNPENFGTADIAIGHSENSFNLNFYPALYNTNDETGKLSCICGYGFTGTFLTGSIKHDNIKRAGSNFIDKTDRDLLICSPSKRNDQKYTTLEFLIASGDSGGGLFIDNKLAGINSCVIGVTSPMSKYNEESGHTRISKFIEWINKNKLSKNE